MVWVLGEVWECGGEIWWVWAGLEGFRGPVEAGRVCYGSRHYFARPDGVVCGGSGVCGEFLALLRHIWCFHAGLEGFRGPAPSMALCLPWRDPVRAAGGVDGVDGVGVVSGSGLGAFGHFWTIWTIWCDPFEDSTPRRLLLSTS